MAKVLIYSDSFVFSGSENVVENILKSEVLGTRHNLNFYYVNNKEYQAGIKRKFTDQTNIKPLGILSAYSQWGNRAIVKRKERSIAACYLWLRYLISYFFQRIGFHDIYNICRLFILFKKEAPEILYINNGGYPGARSCRIAVISARLAGIHKIIFNVNNLAFPPKGFIDTWLDGYIDKKVNVFITASRAAGRRLVEMRNFNAAKCIDIPNTLTVANEEKINTLTGILKKEFSISPDTIVIGAVGLLTHRKGFHILIEAVHHLKTTLNKELPKVVIFGDGEERGLLEGKIKEYGLGQTVLLPGFRGDILAYLKDIDIFTCPSIANEDFPYVILEAMLMAKPVIGTEVAGIPEQVVDGYNGYIVPPGNVAQLAAAIALLTDDKTKQQVMGANGRQRYMENYKNERVIKRYGDLFDSLTGV